MAAFGSFCISLILMPFFCHGEKWQEKVFFVLMGTWLTPPFGILLWLMCKYH